jgi:diaminopimelate decarboxylase
MDIQPIYLRQNEPTHFYDVVGPICETGDFLGYGRELSILQGDLLCVCDAGAYSFSMSSNYNSRPRAPELMISGKDVHVIRQRETIKDIVRGEHLILKMEQ